MLPVVRTQTVRCLFCAALLCAALLCPRVLPDQLGGGPEAQRRRSSVVPGPAGPAASTALAVPRPAGHRYSSVGGAAPLPAPLPLPAGSASAEKAERGGHRSHRSDASDASGGVAGGAVAAGGTGTTPIHHSRPVGWGPGAAPTRAHAASGGKALPPVLEPARDGKDGGQGEGDRNDAHPRRRRDGAAPAPASGWMGDAGPRDRSRPSVAAPHGSRSPVLLAEGGVVDGSDGGQSVSGAASVQVTLSRCVGAAAGARVPLLAAAPLVGWRGGAKSKGCRWGCARASRTRSAVSCGAVPMRMRGV
jgi:hypothetical protein